VVTTKYRKDISLFYIARRAERNSEMEVIITLNFWIGYWIGWTACATFVSLIIGWYHLKY
jgi:hypothetical protein